MRSILFIICAAGLLTSCSKDKITAPDLDITTPSLTYKLGDTITFKFNGDADNVVFFSGEPGNNYEFRKRTTAANKLQIRFTSLVQAGLIYQNLQLRVSNNFSGVADTNAIKAASFPDLSSRAVFSTGTDNTPSGTVDITDQINAQNPSSPIYIAFKYTDYKKTQGQNRWIIRTFYIDKISPEGVVTPLDSMSTAGWKAVNFQNTAANWVIAAASLTMYGGTATALDNEDWVISKGYNASSINPDLGVAIKTISSKPENYKFVYKTPGTYKAVFEISNVRHDGEFRTLKEMTFTITP